MFDRKALALRVVEPFPWRLWAAATIVTMLVAAFALLAYYRPDAAKGLFTQSYAATHDATKAIVEATTVASEHPESLTF